MSDLSNLIDRLLETRNTAHKRHWATTGKGSYAEHVALGEFYDALADHLDGIVEAHQGAFGLSVKQESITEKLAREAGWIEKNREAIAGGSKAIENKIDDLVGLYLSTLYKLENLS